MYRSFEILQNWFSYYKNAVKDAMIPEEEELYDMDSIPSDLSLSYSLDSIKDETISPDNKCYNCEEVSDDIVIGPYNNFWCSRCYANYFVLFRLPYFE